MMDYFSRPRKENPRVNDVKQPFGDPFVLASLHLLVLYARNGAVPVIIDPSLV